MLTQCIRQLVGVSGARAANSSVSHAVSLSTDVINLSDARNVTVQTMGASQSGRLMLHRTFAKLT
jgi:hypothetical protein